MRIIAILIAASLASGCATSAQRQTRERLDTIVIPEIDFREANAHDVVDFLVKSIRCEDRQIESRRQRFGIILTTEAEPEWKDPLGLGTPHDAVPLITFTALHMSVGEALDSVCRATGLRYKIDKNGVIQIQRKSNHGLKATGEPAF